MCKEGRFKETRGVPSTYTRLMTKQELIELSQDDDNDYDIDNDSWSKTTTVITTNNIMTC